MKKFVFKFSYFSFLIITFLVLGLFIPKITFPQNLYFSLNDKHQSLIDIDSPRIILVGGSNLSFGINSEFVEDEFGLKVVNTALHAGLGLKFILNDIKPYLKEGDIVIVSPEYEHFYGNTVYGKTPMLETIIANPETYTFFNCNNFKEIIGTIPETALKNYYKFGLSIYKKMTGSHGIGVYERSSFNKYGDVVSHYALPNEKFSPPIVIKGDYNPKAIEEMILFNEAIEQKDGLFLFSYPCLMNSTYESVETQIDLVKNAIGQSGLNILNEPEEYRLDDTLFFNTQYHLNRIGVEKRTQKLINNLKSNGEFLHFLEKIRTNE